VGCRLTCYFYFMWYSFGIYCTSIALEGNMLSKLQRITLALVLALSTVSCSSCAKKNPDPVTPEPAPSTTVTPEPPKPVVTTVTVKQEGLELTLPSAEWVAVQNPPPHSQAFMNMSKKNGVVVVGEEYTGTYESYVLFALRGIKDSGAQVASAKQVEINGQKFVLVESSKNNIRVWLWVALVGKHGYGVSCGGPDGDAAQKDLCTGIAGSIKITQ
jgi:hypothetical protein